MAFGGRKGELVAVIGCGAKRLDSAKLAPNVTGEQALKIQRSLISHVK